jgi:hypothetical protein
MSWSFYALGRIGKFRVEGRFEGTGTASAQAKGLASDSASRRLSLQNQKTGRCPVSERRFLNAGYHTLLGSAGPGEIFPREMRF